MNANEAKRLNVCCRCKGPPTLSQRLDGTGWRAIYWCLACKRPAFAGASFVKVDESRLARLPIVEREP